jgi:hypothetical protein
MFRKFKNVIWSILNLTPIGPLLQLYLVGELRENGWLRSFKEKKSIDAQGKPTPWYTYPMSDLLAEKLHKTINVFEYGCGGSTQWLANRVNQVDAVEDHEGWLQEVQNQMPANVTIKLEAVTNNDLYAKASTATGKRYELIIVDGKVRNACIKYSLEALAPNGVLLLDDSFREDYLPSFELMEKLGFKKLNFWGMTPIVSTKSCSTLFYKPNNCLGI